MIVANAVPITAAVTNYTQIGNTIKAVKTIPTRIVWQATFNYGAGGTNADVIIQTSLDGGTTWWDIIHFTQFTTSSVTQTYCQTLNLTGVISTPTNLTLASGSVVAGLLGSQVRAMLRSSGTYSTATTISIYAAADEPLGNMSGEVA